MTERKESLNLEKIKHEENNYIDRDGAVAHHLISYF